MNNQPTDQMLVIINNQRDLARMISLIAYSLFPYSNPSREDIRKLFEAIRERSENTK